MESIPKIIAVVGPTASGKTALAVKIAQKFGGEIVSADSCQIYKRMDIGTAKPTRKELTLVPHHLIGFKSPGQSYTVAQYKRDALKAISKILKKGMVPVLAGGTGLYVKSIIDNLNIPEIKPDLRLRKKLEKEIEKYGLNYVFDKLANLDPEAAYIVDPNNPRRIIRALEIALKTRRPFSDQRKFGKPLFDFIEIGVSWPKEKLDERINKRVDLMVADGLLTEIKRLVKRYGDSQKSFDAIGYREIIGHLKGKNSLPEAIDLIKINTRKFARRQMTWFKKDKRINWLNSEKEAEKIVKNFLK